MPSVGACAASSSVVNTSAPSASSDSRSSTGSSALTASQSTVHTIASWSGEVAVAKCAATNGEKVQSSSRVGSPWCWASESQSHKVGPGRSRCAYLRKLRIRWRSSAGNPSPSRARLATFE